MKYMLKSQKDASDSMKCTFFPLQNNTKPQTFQGPKHWLSYGLSLFSGSVEGLKTH